MPINTNVSNLPSAPNRSGSPNTFTSDTDAFLAALPTLQSEINAYAAAANSTGDQISEYLSAAEQGAVTGLDIARWDSEVTYDRFDPVIGSDGNTYRSLADNNLNNDPTTDGGDNWLNLSEVSLAPILKPQLLSPTDGETDIGETPTLDAGDYYSLYGRPHTLSRFQVATDQAFTSIVYDSGEIAATQTHDVPAGNLSVSTTYYWRAYYEDDAANQSDFSDPFEFVTANSFGFTATGGAVTDITEGGVDYRIHTFTSSGTFEVTGDGADVEYLVVAGGGSGGARGGAGGGAGGFLTGSVFVNVSSISVIVGGGGASVTDVASGESGNDGSNSQFSTIESVGGGGGGYYGGSRGAGRDGGSGGGGGGGGFDGGLGTQGQGNDGGDLDPGGGGGAAQPGAEGTSGQPGGDGIFTTINGSNIAYAGGGAGGRAGTFANGGAGGGGDTDSSGVSNSGGGGGGGTDSGSTSGSGGSGIVIIRYPI